MKFTQIYQVKKTYKHNIRERPNNPKNYRYSTSFSAINDDDKTQNTVD